MNKKFKFLVFFGIMFSIFLLQSCASILNFRKQPVSFNTFNSKAIVHINGKEIGQGELIKTKLRRDMYTKQIKVESAGYKTNYYCLFQSKKSPLYILSVVPFTLLFYPPLVDVFPKSYNYEKKNDIPCLSKNSVKTDQMKFIEIKNVAFDVKDIDFKEYKVKIRDLKNNLSKSQQQQDRKKEKSKKKNSTDSKEKSINADNSIYADELMTTLKRNGFVDTTNLILSDNNNTVFLSSTVSSLSFNKVVPNNSRRSHYSYFYFAQAEVTWRIENVYHEILASLKMKSESGQFTSDYFIHDDMGQKIISDLMQNSLNSLLADSTIASFLKTNKTDDKILLQALMINKPSGFITSLEEAKNASVIIRTSLGHGSGFAISNDGFIITNYHVIAGSSSQKQEDITVITSEGEMLHANIIRFDTDHDLALLKVEKKFISCFYIPSSQNYSMADDVSTIGAPRSIELGHSLSKGIIASERKMVNNDLLQLNMSVNAGNSGGPVFKNNGKDLIGVVDSKIVGSEIEGIAFCIPAYKIADYLKLKFQ